ncbi:MAG: hypothetical protein ACXVRV_15920, partial [Gaiellaceae bacterium]
MRPRIDEKRDKNGELSGYQVRWSLRPGRGARAQARTFSRKKFGSLDAAHAAAEKAWIEKLAAFQAGEATDELRFGALSVEQWIIEHYWRFHVPRKVKSRASQQQYRRFIVNYIRPQFGRMRLCDITAGMLDRWLTLLTEPCERRGVEPCAACRAGKRCTLALPESQRDSLVTVLWSMFGYAHRSGHLLQNPAAPLTKLCDDNPRQSRKARERRDNPPSPEDIEFLRRHMSPTDSLYLLVRYVCAFRPSETFALAFDDLLNPDLTGKQTVLIWKVVDPTTNPPSIRDLTKTREDREVEFAELSPRMVEEVVAELHRRNAVLSDPVFLNENGNSDWWTPQHWHSTRWVPAMLRAGFGSSGSKTYFTPYEIRHTACSLWAVDRRGYSLSQLADQAGNSPLTLEQHYRKRFSDPKRYQNKTMDEIVRAAQAAAAERPLLADTGRHYTRPKSAEIERLALTGMRYSQIAAALGTSYSEVSRLMGDLGYTKLREGSAWVLSKKPTRPSPAPVDGLILADALEEGLGT